MIIIINMNSLPVFTKHPTVQTLWNSWAVGYFRRPIRRLSRPLCGMPKTNSWILPEKKKNSYGNVGALKHIVINTL